LAGNVLAKAKRGRPAKHAIYPEYAEYAKGEGEELREDQTLRTDFLPLDFAGWVVYGCLDNQPSR
jgi:hypothetical protein